MFWKRERSEGKGDSTGNDADPDEQQDQQDVVFDPLFPQEFTIIIIIFFKFVQKIKKHQYLKKRR
jgi:hypothetical protein